MNIYISSNHSCQSTIQIMMPTVTYSEAAGKVLPGLSHCSARVASPETCLPNAISSRTSTEGSSWGVDLLISELSGPWYRDNRASQVGEKEGEHGFPAS